MIRSSAFAVSVVSLVLAAGCAVSSSDEAVDSSSDELKGPGSKASDQRVPELGSDLNVLTSAQVTLAQGIAAVSYTHLTLPTNREV